MEIYPIESLTVALLTKRAKVGTASFFRHYPNIDALLADLSQSIVDDLAAHLRAVDVDQRRGAAAHAVAVFAAEHRTVLRPLMLGAGAALESAVKRQAAIDTSSLRRTISSCPPELAIEHMVGATISTMAWWLREPNPCDADELAILLDRLAFRPVASDRETATGHPAPKEHWKETPDEPDHPCPAHRA